MNIKNQNISQSNRLPAEWSPQACVLFTWPHKDMDWDADELIDVQNCLMDMIHPIAQTQKVLITAHNTIVSENILSLMQSRGCDANNIEILLAKSNDVWARDHGPITIYEQGYATLLNFQFNGWGEKFVFEYDNAINEQLSQSKTLQHYTVKNQPLVFEGGSFDTDGIGTLLTTERCLCNPNRGNHLDKSALTSQLKSTLGVDRVLWLTHGNLEGDNTDAHVDMLARFLNPSTIAYTATNDPHSPDYAELQKMATELKAFKQPNGQPYKLVPIPTPNYFSPLTQERLPATYLNFLITNDCVFVPQYQTKQDSCVLSTFQELFTKRKIIGIDARALIHQAGGLHCATMQISQYQCASE